MTTTNKHTTSHKISGSTKPEHRYVYSSFLNKTDKQEKESCERGRGCCLGSSGVVRFVDQQSEPYDPAKVLVPQLGSWTGSSLVRGAAGRAWFKLTP